MVDTSVLTRMRVEPVQTALRELSVAGRLGRCAMTDLELGFSARNGHEWDTIVRALAAFTRVEVAARDFRRAEQVQRSLADAGLKGRKVPDLISAAVAERRGWELVHYDHDFEHITGATGQPHRWIVAAGSID
ncbi:PIN domain-containing protein [Microlunatus elymi]|uniref:PIN domain-containing protein n=1 Tax=Microlunatus elymi TaxID=2596828 RepID=UPI00143D84D4|nr:PIN domain-containing protein [Microlunatus elymi]